MTEEFTASNGIKVVERYESKRVYLHDTNGKNLMENWDFIGTRDTVALAEYYRAKEDERLGRWRSARHPEYVVAQSDQSRAGRSGSWVSILHEPTHFERLASRSTVISSLDRHWPDMKFGEVAEEFFDAHPEPKPWHAAAEGEVWELSFNSAAASASRRGGSAGRVPAQCGAAAAATVGSSSTSRSGRSASTRRRRPRRRDAVTTPPTRRAFVSSSPPRGVHLNITELTKKVKNG